MNRLKSNYISVFLIAVVAALAVSIRQLLQQPPDPAWWGLLLAAAAPLGFFSRLFLAPVARTGRNLWWMPAAGGVGALLAALLGGIVPALLALGLGGLCLLYTHWYSRFEHRDAAALAIGQPLPPITLEDVDGRVVDAAELTAKPALWMFYRGNWCPLCMAQIREVAAQYRELSARGVEVLLISPQSQNHTRDLAQRFEVPMRFLVDRDNRAAARLGVLAESGLPQGMQVLGYDADVPMPTVFITAAGGRIVYSDLTDNYRIRPEPAEFVAALNRAGI